MESNNKKILVNAMGEAIQDSDEEAVLKRLHSFYLSTKVNAHHIGQTTDLEYINVMVGSVLRFITEQAGNDIAYKNSLLEYFSTFVARVDASARRVIVH